MIFIFVCKSINNAQCRLFVETDESTLEQWKKNVFENQKKTLISDLKQPIKNNVVDKPCINE